jgi:hypothetical protein
MEKSWPSRIKFEIYKWAGIVVFVLETMFALRIQLRFPSILGYFIMFWRKCLEMADADLSPIPAYTDLSGGCVKHCEISPQNGKSDTCFWEITTHTHSKRTIGIRHGEKVHDIDESKGIGDSNWHEFTLLITLHFLHTVRGFTRPHNPEETDLNLLATFRNCYLFCLQRCRYPHSLASNGHQFTFSMLNVYFLLKLVILFVFWQFGRN